MFERLLTEFSESGSRTLLLNGMSDSNAQIVAYARANGYMDGDKGWLIIHPEEVSASLPAFDGTFSVLPSHEIQSTWAAVGKTVPPLTAYADFVSKGGIADDPFIATAMEQSPFCSENQDKVCNSTLIGNHNGMSSSDNTTAVPIFG